MKYLIINGSPRKKNTWNIVRHVEENLDGEFEEIHLIKHKIPMCNGCFKCFEKGESECPHFEYLNPIVEKIKECDGLIITSPVYALNVSGLLKNLFDHTAYIYHRPQFFDKKALIVVSTAGAGQKNVAKYIDETLRHWGFNKNFKLAFAFGDRENLEAKEISKINKTSQKFRNDVESGKLHSPKFMDVIFFNVWKAMAVMDNPIKADCRFWYETGLVNHDFSPEVKLGIVKKAFSKIMFAILKRVI